MTVGYRGTADSASLSYYEQQMNCDSSPCRLIARKNKETSNSNALMETQIKYDRLFSLSWLGFASFVCKARNLGHP